MDTLSLPNSCCVIVRSVGERTEEVCLQIVASQLRNDNLLFIVRDKPFHEAHAESIRIALEVGAKWSIFLDADVLLRKDALATMLQEAESIDTPFYMLNFRVLDRGFGGPAYGVHLYLTQQLHTAIQFAGLVRQTQRPETSLCREMALRARIPTLGSSQLVGLHGYEQYYTDIYRTTFVRAVKFKPIAGHLLRWYRTQYQDHENGSSDADVVVMFWGLVDGIVFGLEHDTAPLHKPFYLQKACQVLSMLHLEEKGPFFAKLDEIQNTIEYMIGHFQPHPIYQAIQYKVCPTARIQIAPPDRFSRRRIIQNLYSLWYRMMKIVSCKSHASERFP